MTRRAVRQAFTLPGEAGRDRAQTRLSREDRSRESDCCNASSVEDCLDGGDPPALRARGRCRHRPSGSRGRGCSDLEGVGSRNRAGSGGRDGKPPIRLYFRRPRRRLLRQPRAPYRCSAGPQRLGYRRARGPQLDDRPQIAAPQAVAKVAGLNPHPVRTTRIAEEPIWPVAGKWRH